MKRIFHDVMARIAGSGLFILLSAALGWRAMNYPSVRDTSMLAPLLCMLLALLLGITGVTMAMRGAEFDQGAEQEPARQV